MERWLITFLIVAVVAWLIGFTGLVYAIVKIAKFVFYIAMILFIGALAKYFMDRSKKT